MARGNNQRVKVIPKTYLATNATATMASDESTNDSMVGRILRGILENTEMPLEVEEDV